VLDDGLTLAHAPERLHEEIAADYSDMIYAATRQEIEVRRKDLHPQVAAQAPRRLRQPGGSRRPSVHLQLSTGYAPVELMRSSRVGLPAAAEI
jgi:hypothetical protein